MRIGKTKYELCVPNSSKINRGGNFIWGEQQNGYENDREVSEWLRNMINFIHQMCVSKSP